MIKKFITYLRIRFNSRIKIGDRVILYGVDDKGNAVKFLGIVAKIYEFGEQKQYKQVELENVFRSVENTWIRQANNVFGDYGQCFLTY